MTKIQRKQKLASKRKARVRGKIFGTSNRPRLSVFRSNKYLYLQVIDDDQGVTLAAESNNSLAKKSKKALTGTKIKQAQEIAKALGKKLETLKIKKLKFDRGSASYHGRVKAVAEALRELGIEV